MRRVIGVVLAGGASRRMGTPKHTVTLPDGRTFGEAVVMSLTEALSTIDHAPRVVVAGLPDSAAPIGALEIIPDRRPGLGPLAGLDAALDALAADADHLLVVPCDMPMLTGALLRDLLVPTDATATIFADAGGEPRPLPMRVATTAAATVETRLVGDDRSLRGLVAALGAEVVGCATPGVLRSVNTPEECAVIDATIGRRS